MKKRKPRVRRSRALIRQQTREALLAAGVAEFVENGIDAPSLDNICARAGHTRGAFYVHFRDREDFLVAVMERVIGPFLDVVIASGDDSHDLERTIERFADAVRVAMRGGAAPSVGPVIPPFASGLAFHRILEACTRSPEMRRRVVRLLDQAVMRLARTTRRGQAALSVRGDVDAKQVGFLLLSLALGVITAVELGVSVDLTRARAEVQRLFQAPAPEKKMARAKSGG